MKERREDLSKYVSVDEAVKWSVNVFRAIIEDAWDDEKWRTCRSDYIQKPAALEMFMINKENNFKKFAEKLENNLVSKLEENIKSRANNSQYTSDLLKKRKSDYNSIDLKKVFSDTLKELGFIPWLSNFIRMAVW
jgi:hypothetical protein